MPVVNACKLLTRDVFSGLVFSSMSPVETLFIIIFLIPQHIGMLVLNSPTDQRMTRLCELSDGLYLPHFTTGASLAVNTARCQAPSEREFQ